MSYQTLISKTKWLIQGATITPHLDAFATSNITAGLEKLAPGIGLSIILTFFQKKGDLGNWTLDEDFLYSRGKYLEEHPEIIEKLFLLWKKNSTLYLGYVKKLETSGIQDLEKEYSEFIDLYEKEYTPALVTEYFTVWSDVIIARILKTVPKELHQEVQQLSLPSQLTFMGEESLSALRIGLQLKSIGEKEERGKEKEIILPQLKRKYPNIFSQLGLHQKQFYWMNCGYKYTPEITTTQFLKNIQESIILLDKGSIQLKIDELVSLKEAHTRKKEDLLRRKIISQKDITSLELVSKVAWFHDQRKKCNIIGSYWANQFLIKAAKEKNMNHKLLQFTLPKEFLKFLKTGHLNVPLLKERMKGCVFVNCSDGESRLLHGEDFLRLKKSILDISTDKELHDFRGTVASFGKVEGKAKIILNPNKQNLEKGDILIASMTRPEYVPLMKRASAIVTDEGGITSHAAIISRELGIPCIVGTKIATKVLHDGDLIEVNGNHGLVKIIKRNSV